MVCRLTGILPTLRKFDLELHNLTPMKRYDALMKAITGELIGNSYELRLMGIDEILVKHDSPLLEACNTSFQVHLQVAPKDFVKMYNMAQVLAAPVMAIGSNSPLVFGKRLWHESRIAMFQQSIDTRSTHDHVRDQSPRVSFGNGWLQDSVLNIHREDIAGAVETYDLMSKKYFTHATPTLFNAGTPKPQMSSCFLLTMKDDSIDGIYDTLKQCSKISQSAGGIGLSIHNVRATGSYIRGTNGTSNGIVPMLRVFNDTARYVDQGGGKRKGSFAIYLEPWHADIFEFLDLKKNHGKEEMRARDLFYALWTPDLFMERVKENGEWTLMDPNECPGLADVYGDKFKALYTKYEQAGKGRKTIKARDLWQKITESQIETGTPYMLYKDAANEKSNQKNLGTIRSSNLCTEIIEYTAPDEVAVCNLASLALPMYVEDGAFNHQKLYEVTYKATKNLNRIIDGNYYPVAEARNSNMRHRPIGLGVQGLADTFIKLRLPFTSDEAKALNKDIFETIYYASLCASRDEAKVDGPYETIAGSPISNGEFQFDMWGVDESSLSGNWDWKTLKTEVMEHGIRNSLLLAPMPTASTSQILGNNECFEPYTSNIYTRRVLSGEFIVVNKHLLIDLVDLGLWNDDLKNEIIRANGSIQHIDIIPNNIKDLYKTVWEMSMKDIIDMSADRGMFIDQSQSLNLFVENANIGKMTSMHFYAWEKGLKTGMYYLRTKAATDAIKFTVQKQAKSQVEPVTDAKQTEKIQEKENLEKAANVGENRVAEMAKAVQTYTAEETLACSIDNPDDCEACGS